MEWLTSLSDTALVELLDKIDTCRFNAVITNAKLVKIANGYYADDTGIMRMQHLFMDVWREASNRFKALM